MQFGAVDQWMAMIENGDYLRFGAQDKCNI